MRRQFTIAAVLVMVVGLATTLRLSLAFPAQHQADIRSTLRVVDREFAIATALKNGSRLERIRLLVSWRKSAASCLELAIDANRSLLTGLRTGDPQLASLERKRLVVNLSIILFDSGETTEANALLAELGSSAIVPVLRFAYMGQGVNPKHAPLDRLVPSEAARQALEARLADRRGETVTAERIRITATESALSSATPSLWFSLVLLLIVGCGALWAIRASRPGSRGPWSWQPRAGVFTFAVAVGAWIASVHVAMSSGNRIVQSFLPDVLVILVVLLTLHALKTVRPIAMGGRPSDRIIVNVMGLVAFLISVDIVAQPLVDGVLSLAGFSRGWLEVSDPFWATAPYDELFEAAVGIAVLSPISEELTFRIVLYSTLRGLFGVLGATSWSAGVFALAHPSGSLTTITSIALLGCLTAVGFEKCRTLTPIVLLHGAHNLLPAIGALLRYQ